MYKVVEAGHKYLCLKHKRRFLLQQNRNRRFLYFPEIFEFVEQLSLIILAIFYQNNILFKFILSIVPYHMLKLYSR